MTRNDEETASHTNTVRKIIEAAHNTWQALLQLQASDDVNPDGVFIQTKNYGSIHPQKKAHSHLLGYHSLIANKTYTVRAQDMWQEKLQTEKGKTYEIEVPESNTVHLGSEALELANIKTKTENLTLEQLNHKWGMRYITVHRLNHGSWGDSEKTVKQRRLWLPPKGIELAFEQLEDVRAKIGLGADLGTPDYHENTVLDPAEGVREPYEDRA